MSSSNTDPSKGYVEEAMATSRGMERIRFTRRTGMSAEDSARLEQALSDMNTAISDAFNKHVARAIESDSPVPDEALGAYLDAFTSAELSAEEQITKISPKVAQAVENGELSAAMHLSPSNQRDHLLVAERFRTQIERLVSAESLEGAWKPPTE